LMLWLFHHREQRRRPQGNRRRTPLIFRVLAAGIVFALSAAIKCRFNKGDAEGAASMATTTKSTKAAVKASRYDELRQMLEERRRELMNEVQGRIRDARSADAKDREVLDQGESSEVDIQEDIEFALIQMKSETLNKINEALRRLEEGTYGNCFECGEEIAHARLRALPFAVRCKDCEEARENAEQRERMMARKSGSSALFFDMSN